jgi:DNA damage-binding protein 1
MILALANVQLAKSLDAQPTSASSGCESVEVPAVKPYLLVGTAYALPDEDEPTRGRVLVLSCADEDGGGSNRGAKHVTELEVHGGVYSISQFYNGLVLLSINSKTMVSQLTQDAGSLKLSFLGIGHHGHILSLIVSSRAPLTLTSVNDEKSSVDDSTPVKKKPAKVEGTEQLAIVADLMRSISLVQYYPEHKALEEVARDFNSNWTTAAAMLTDNLYLGAENWNNLYVLRRNAKAASEEIRCRLDTVGQFHLGEACNKFITGSLTMAYSQNSSSTPSSTTRRKAASPAKSSKEKASAASSVRTRRPVVTIGSQTLFGTVDGTLGAILGLDARTAAFFTSLERCMSKTIAPVGNFSHSDFRTFDAENRVHPSQGFVDGDLVESFLDLDRTTMEAVVTAMNSDGGWEIECHHLDKSKKDDQEDTEMSSGESILNVEDVLAMVEEMTMFH